MAKTRLFALDCVIYRPIKNAKDCLQLQRDLIRLAEWEDKWGMCFHPENILRVTRPRAPVMHPYTQMNCQNTPELRNLSWNPYIDQVVKKDNTMLGFL